MLSITKKFTFEAAHYLPGYDGKCANLHGHSYKLEVTVSGVLDSKSLMILDFSKLSKIVKNLIIDKFDHSCLNNIYEHPTAECMILDIKNILQEKFKESLIKLKLYETEDSFVEWGA